MQGIFEFPLPWKLSCACIHSFSFMCFNLLSDVLSFQSTGKNNNNICCLTLYFSTPHAQSPTKRYFIKNSVFSRTSKEKGNRKSDFVLERVSFSRGEWRGKSERKTTSWSNCRHIGGPTEPPKALISPRKMRKRQRLPPFPTTHIHASVSFRRWDCFCI